MAREINLVPDIKNEMIKALKLRNFIFFLCIVVAAGSVTLVLLLNGTVGIQSLIIDGNKKTIENMSEKISSYSDLDEFLTIKDQLNGLATISSNKIVFSRTFNILSALHPEDSVDELTFSELTIDLTDPTYATYSFSAQADAKQAPYIDYNVLDSFKKSMAYVTYDYGRYVDKNGLEIPTYCIVDIDEDGNTLADENGNLFAYWTIDKTGCNPSVDESVLDDSEDTSDNSSFNLLDDGFVQNDLEDKEEDKEGKYADEYSYTSYDDELVVKIWRTPQFDEWYKKEYMTTDGIISDIAHFESRCYIYTGTEKSDGTIEWDEDNSQCPLVPDGVDGITIRESTNGRNSDNELVLMFDADLLVSKEVYNFNNKHMLAFGPSGKFNVTDSYVQIEHMFSQKAKRCTSSDTECKESK